MLGFFVLALNFYSPKFLFVHLLIEFLTQKEKNRHLFKTILKKLNLNFLLNEELFYPAMTQNNKPEKVYKAGALSLSLWENEGKDNMKLSSFSFQRAYKDEKDEWQHTQNLRIQDLPKLRILVEQAYKDQVLAMRE